MAAVGGIFARLATDVQDEVASFLRNGDRLEASSCSRFMRVALLRGVRRVRLRLRAEDRGREAGPPPAPMGGLLRHMVNLKEVLLTSWSDPLVMGELGRALGEGAAQGIKVLQVWGTFRNIRENLDLVNPLHLSRLAFIRELRITGGGYEVLATVGGLGAGVVPLLENLTLGDFWCADGQVRLLAADLNARASAGHSPLRKLELTLILPALGGEEGEEVGIVRRVEGLGELLASQSLALLEGLSVSIQELHHAPWVPMHIDDLGLVGDYLSRRGRGGLRAFYLRVRWEGAPPQCMIDAIRSGALSGLEDNLFLPLGEEQEATRRAVIAALVEGGGCPRVTCVDIGEPSRVEALAAGVFPAVEVIAIDDADMNLDVEELCTVLGLLADDKLPCLRDVTLWFVMTLPEDMLPLWAAAIRGGLTRVRSLDVEANRGVISTLVEGFEGGHLGRCGA